MKDKNTTAAGLSEYARELTDVLKDQSWERFVRSA